MAEFEAWPRRADEGRAPDAQREWRTRPVHLAVRERTRAEGRPCRDRSRGLDPSRFPFSAGVRIRLPPGRERRPDLRGHTLRVWRPFQFLAAIDEERPDILHFNGASLWYALLLPVLTRRYPVIVTIHDVTPHPGSRAWDQDFARRLFLRYADAVIVHGEWARRQLGAEQPTYVIPHGDYAFFAEAGEGEGVAEEDAVLFFGRIEPVQGAALPARGDAARLGRVPRDQARDRG